MSPLHHLSAKGKLDKIFTIFAKNESDSGLLVEFLVKIEEIFSYFILGLDDVRGSL